MLRHADITGYVPEYHRKKGLEDSGVLLGDSRDQYDDPSRRLYGKFAGILQVEIRQQVYSIHMLMITVCAGTMR
jgi:hypothetical protein